MNIQKKQNDTELTIALAGRLDTNTAPLLEHELEHLAQDEIKHLYFDFSELEYISSAGLRILLAMQKTMSKIGSMKVTNVNAQIMEAFDITGFSDFLTIE